MATRNYYDRKRLWLRALSRLWVEIALAISITISAIYNAHEGRYEVAALNEIILMLLWVHIDLTKLNKK